MQKLTDHTFMKKTVFRVAVLSLLAVAMAVTPTTALGQGKKKGKVAGEQNEPAKGEKKQGAIPFRGKLTSVDKSAKTITVGERTFQITSETRIMKAGKPATLDDAVVGEEVGGQYKKAGDGKLVAGMVRFGPRPEGESNGKKKKDKE